MTESPVDRKKNFAFKRYFHTLILKNARLNILRDKFIFLFKKIYAPLQLIFLILFNLRQ
jgi:hypothetical protein